MRIKTNRTITLDFDKEVNGEEIKFSITFDFITSEDFDYSKKSGAGIMQNAIRKSIVSWTGFEDYDTGEPLEVNDMTTKAVLEDVIKLDNGSFYDKITEALKGLTIKK